MIREERLLGHDDSTVESGRNQRLEVIREGRLLGHEAEVARTPG